MSIAKYAMKLYLWLLNLVVPLLSIKFPSIHYNMTIMYIMHISEVTIIIKFLLNQKNKQLHGFIYSKFDNSNII